MNIDIENASSKVSKLIKKCSEPTVLIVLVLIAGITAYFSYSLMNQLPLKSNFSDRVSFYFQHGGLIIKSILFNIFGFCSFVGVGLGILGFHLKYDAHIAIKVAITVIAIGVLLCSLYFLNNLIIIFTVLFALLFIVAILIWLFTN